MNKRPTGKSILQNFGAFSEPAADGGADAPVDGNKPSVPQPLPRVGAGVIGATQRSLSELREERDRLRAMVDSGGGAELDPMLIDPSPFPDRLPDDSSADFESLKALISEEGQKVPIQVRRHPSVEGRYQVVYGHRRWRAALELGVKVKATILDLSDSELVVAQGIENAARQDLSWIERSLFAWRMDQAGIKSRDIRAALSIDDPELARLRAVAKVLPTDVIEAIGRAPKVGRPRWIALASAVEEDKAALSRIRETLSADKVLERPSDERFKSALAAVKKPVERARSELELKSPKGKVVGKATFSAGDVKFSVSSGHAEAFGAFLEEELPGLMERFFAREGDE
ncbi:plasmid partitioning protein RepB [Xanthobacter autotrophicus]|uniref:plasmid partitioning protein RepB n=1 Tax=Xanthobacter TaxID=279 RepID=UPI0024AAF822|nr:plasmid partitioning protein RepB [Xanthobacter autotrophicus]MDI4666944.1 plasmid partitioning protein RepB [Xanthobacter autotrophicus]